MESLDDNWDCTDLEAASFAPEIQQVHLCALRNEFNEGDEAGEAPTNHWVLCLETSKSSSIMIDMAPGYGTDGLRGKIQVSLCNGCYTDEALQVFSFTPKRVATVGSVLEFIQSRGRQAFNFSPEWEGCRHWLSVVMADLDHAGWIAEGSSVTARDALLKYWRNPEGSEPRVMREGLFRS
ncbi:hypothetical protein F5Y14DRAFT_417309 [Nemania sp. NC0429]|nr:hypothetical protein F5Y14DRAFT_417309 [Nemania sp. NC0429]